MIWKRWGMGMVLVFAMVSGRLAYRPVRVSADDMIDSVAFTDMDQMIFDARQAFKAQQFDVAITTCEKILRKDPDQLVALKIMGAGYYMINEYERARHVWKRALEVAPDDAEIPKYMARLPAENSQ